MHTGTRLLVVAFSVLAIYFATVNLSVAQGTCGSNCKNVYTLATAAEASYTVGGTTYYLSVYSINAAGTGTQIRIRDSTTTTHTITGGQYLQKGNLRLNILGIVPNAADATKGYVSVVEVSSTCGSRTCGTAASAWGYTATCGSCPTRLNAMASCSSSGACAYECVQYYQDCNNNAADGCEINVAYGDNVNNCGSCGRVCSSANGTASCTDGTCSILCNPYYKNCNNNAADGCEVNVYGRPEVGSTVQNCGNCGAGYTCTGLNAATWQCVSGGCAVVSCSSGYGNCDGKSANGCETNLNANVTNCGGCGNICNSNGGTAKCTNGACSITCAMYQQNCDQNPANGCEVQDRGDAKNCGSCGNVCSSINGAPSCANGVCQISCNPYYKNCNGDVTDGCEVNVYGRPDVGSTIQNCGDCGSGHVCTGLNAATWQCVSGGCAVVTCNSGYENCDGSGTNGCEVNRNTDVKNCGACGNVCNSNNGTASCVGGTCQIVCNQYYSDCNNNVADGCEVNIPYGNDVNNCGSCGRVCSSNHATPSCTSGTCNLVCASYYGDCDKNSANGCEVNIQYGNDPKNCGKCGTVCAADQKCTSGTCVDGTPPVITVAKPAGGSAYVGYGTTSYEVNIKTDESATCKYTDSTNSILSDTTKTDLQKFDALTSTIPTYQASTNYVYTLTGLRDGQTVSHAVACKDANSNVRIVKNALSVTVGTCAQYCTGANRECTAAGSCACRSGWVDCNGGTDGCEVASVQFDVDPTNCGSCGNKCSTNGGAPKCTNGVCSTSCTGYNQDCNQNPADGCEVNVYGTPGVTGSIITNCGGCGSSYVCAGLHASLWACTSGSCAVSSCDSGWQNCDGKSANGCEVNTAANATNCGSCGNACSSNHGVASCSGGGCGIACSSGYSNCDGSLGNGCETATQTSVANCGGCGIACSTNGGTASCTSGTCKISCSPYFKDCDGNVANGCEVNVYGGNTNNCGICGKVCSGMHAVWGCSSGGCAVTSCEGSWADCDGKSANGCEVNTAANATNCGSCGNACAVTQSCQNGVCMTGPCDDPRQNATVCNGRVCGAVNDNCGVARTCGTCPSGQNCNANGVCFTPVTLSVALESVEICDSSVAVRYSKNFAEGACFYKGASFAPWDGTYLNNVVRFLQNGAYGGCLYDGSPTNTGIRTVTGTVMNTALFSPGISVVLCHPDMSNPVVCSSPKTVTACTGPCSDTRPDAAVCGAKVCGTALDNCQAPRNCGTCSLPNAISSCTASGTCAVSSCNAGYADCSTAASGCETQLSTNTDCAGCGNTCPGGQSCQNGLCTPGQCADPRSDAAVCGSKVCGTATDNCGNTRSCGACGQYSACSMTGTCVCNVGYFDCNQNAADGCEKNAAALGSDSNNCGSCGNVCPSGQTCQNGVCTPGPCSDSRSDTAVCNGKVCGTALDSCGVSRSCGTCGPYSACGAVGTCVCNVGYFDCTQAAGCETQIGTNTNCANCGNDCTAINLGGAWSCNAGTHTCDCTDITGFFGLFPSLCPNNQCTPATVVQVCGVGNVCRGGQCCAPDRTCAAQTCPGDTCTDDSCGTEVTISGTKVCPEGETCQNGACVPEQCVDPRDDFTVCDDKVCGTAADSCGVARTCGTCAGDTTCETSLGACVLPCTDSDGGVSIFAAGTTEGTLWGYSKVAIRAGVAMIVPVGAGEYEIRVVGVGENNDAVISINGEQFDVDMDDPSGRVIQKDDVTVVVNSVRFVDPEMSDFVEMSIGASEQDFCFMLTQQVEPIETCSGDGCAIAEYECDKEASVQGYVHEKVVACPNGCSAGACLPEEVGCTSDDDCASTQECADGTCVDREEPPVDCGLTACYSGERCVAHGTRTSEDYCDSDGQLKRQKALDSSCFNSYECDSNLCLNDVCVSGTGPVGGCGKTECDIDGECIAYGARIGNRYCAGGTSLMDQKVANHECANNFECTSNLCTGEKCVNPTILQMILDWFAAFFRGGK